MKIRKPDKLSAVIFDFDGVVVNTEMQRFKVLKKVCRHYGLILDNHDYEQMIGKRTEFFLRQRFPKLSHKEVEQLETERRGYQKKHIAEKVHSARAVRGIKKILENLARNKIKITISTGSHKEIVWAILRKLNIHRYFGRIVTNLKESKPDPECFERALIILRTPINETIVIEDSVPGIQAARKLKLFTIGITTTTRPFALKAAGADVVLRNHEEIERYIKKEWLKK